MSVHNQAPELVPFYSAADAFRDRCLRRDGSLFTPDQPVWSTANLHDLVERFVHQPDLSSDPFLTKLQRQLGGAPDAVVQLAAEALFAHIIVAGNVGGAAKRTLVGTVLSWMSHPPSIPPALDAAFDTSVAAAGTAFNTLRPYQLAYLLLFVQGWKASTADEQAAALDDPWEFKRLAWAAPLQNGSYAQREALLHLVHPDTFEPIISRRIKDEIASAFADLVPEEEEDVDRKLLAIRSQLTGEYGAAFSFYDAEIAATWRADAAASAKRFVKIATGDNGKFWPDDLAGSYIAVGWEEVADLRTFPSFAAFRSAFAAAYPYGGHASTVTKKARELWTLRELNVGDVVVANRGESEVLAVGTVVEPGYDWLAEHAEAPHIVHVDWDVSKARRIPPVGAWALTTVMDLSPELVRVIVGGRPMPAVTASDFEVLQKYPESKPWGDVPHGDQTSLGLLRRKVQDYGEHLQRELEATSKLSPFVSTLNPNGRTAGRYWSCVYPSDVGNKSYAFQLFVIVESDHIEYGFGSGSGESQIKDPAKTTELTTKLAEARARLAATRGAAWWSDVDRDVRAAGLAYRRRWREQSVPALPDYDAWLSVASSPDGAAAAISGFLSATEVIALGRGLAGRLVELLRPLVRLMDAVYGEPIVGPHITIAQLADTLSVETSYLEDVQWLLEDRRQLVFYGPPGTGKTYVAEAFAEWFSDDPHRVEVIQFHPSYAYEDFVEGIRPDLDERELRYRLVPGVLRRFAARAKEDPANRYVLIIDEINRTNLARVFGELLYLLEYRKRAVTLPYSQEKFALPENLYVIGTMNTADRSIALVDFALRRRFHFVHFPADPQILRTWLGRHRKDMVAVADYLAWVNTRIGQPDFAIGFSYFMRDDLDAELLDRIWSRSVLPAIEEYYFNEPGAAGAFHLSEVRKQVSGQAKPDAVTSDVVEDQLGAAPVDAAASGDDAPAS